MITFTRSWRGYAAGTSVSTLADTIEALAVAEGAATYGGASYPLNSFLDADNRAQALVEGAGNVVNLGATTSTWANRAALVTAGATQAFFTDIGVGGSFWFYSGGRWRPVGGRVTLKNLTTLATHNTSTRAVMDYATLPAGLWQDGDVVEMEWCKTISGTDSDLTETGLGTTPIASFGDAMQATTALLSNTNPHIAARYSWRKLGPTSVLLTSITGSVGYGAAGSIATTPTISTDLDTTTTYLQISGKLTTGAGAISTLRAFAVTLIGGA